MAETSDLETLKLLFTKYNYDELEAIYFLYGKNFKKTCTFLCQPELNTSHSLEVNHNNHENVIDNVMLMARHDCSAQKIAKRFGMHITTVAWEDCARDKNSSLGPCIYDMTLEITPPFKKYGYSCLPVIRYPNYNDMTWDVPIEKISLMVGNENGSKELRCVSLKEYLDTIVTKNSLYCKEKDSHVLFSAQACMLPVLPGDEPTFNVALYSYQSYTGDPSVLTIVASSQGTSAQTLEDRKAQKLYFNKDGQKASFQGRKSLTGSDQGQSLTDNRKERGVSSKGDMTSAEKEANVIMIIQVPLKQKPVQMVCKNYITHSHCIGAPWSIGDDEELGMGKGGLSDDDDEYNEKCDVENVTVKVSDKDEGPFPIVKYKDLTRDIRFPIRVTLQFYKATSNGVIDEKSMSTIAEQFITAQKDAEYPKSFI